ncbi:MAG: hypothetical protein RBS57_21150 [Desulforhabdus sp.]|jgi:hypothetical protein|nr:hypothetical protein [Desulforhabdus sp.]
MQEEPDTRLKVKHARQWCEFGANGITTGSTHGSADHIRCKADKTDCSATAINRGIFSGEEVR